MTTTEQKRQRRLLQRMAPIRGMVGVMVMTPWGPSVQPVWVCQLRRGGLYGPLPPVRILEENN